MSGSGARSPWASSRLRPAPMFPLGTDQLGRDYLSRLLSRVARRSSWGSWPTPSPSCSDGRRAGGRYVRSLRMPLPGGYGIGVPVEAGLMRLADVGLAFRRLLLAMALTSAFGRSLTLVTIVIAAVLWTTMARLIYARVLMLRSQESVTAARALGTGTVGILRRHLLPQVIPLALVYGSLGLATAILFEAGLSFLGAGAPQDTPTWGAMLDRQTGSLATDPRLALLPAFAIFVTVMAFNLLGDCAEPCGRYPIPSGPDAQVPDPTRGVVGMSASGRCRCWHSC